MASKGLKVLMISSDRLICAPESPVSRRMADYGTLVDELHIVLLSDKKHGLREAKIGPNVFVYPTSSISKFLRPFDAIRVGKRISADLITTQDPFECGWAGLRLKTVKDVPLEVQLHTDPFSKQFSGFQNSVRKMLMGMVLKNADSMRTVLASVADQVRSKYGVPNVSALPIYIDRSRIDEEPKFDLHERFGWKHVILAVSRISREKNLGIAIKAVERVPEAGLVIVGDGPERSNFKETDKVKFVGWQEDLASYYKTADVFIQTSLFEGYGLSLVEAGLSGLPVVSTPVGIARELKNVSIANTAEEFADKIGLLLKNPSTGLRAELESKLSTKESYLSSIKEAWFRTANL
jgi:glycosyltransferase involved in cell wall biosynthesis